MTSAADSLFVDTNVLVYVSWAIAPLHTHARSILATRRSAGAPSLLVGRSSANGSLPSTDRALA
jgi:hypothetical protein